MTDKDTFKKAVTVITSCNTLDQLRVAEKYTELAKDSVTDLGYIILSETSKCQYRDILNKTLSKPCKEYTKKYLMITCGG